MVSPYQPFEPGRVAPSGVWGDLARVVARAQLRLAAADATRQNDDAARSSAAPQEAMPAARRHPTKS
jgi:hypothetical protein